MAEPELLLSIDIGTTGIKTGLFTVDGQLLRMTHREQVMSFPQPDRVEQSPARAWQLMRESVREATEGYDKKRIAAISLTNQRGTAIALDEDGNPLTEFIVWMDKRGLPFVEWLWEHVGGERYYSTAGHPIVSITGISKLLWIQRSARDIWQRTAVIGPPQTYFLRRLGADDLVCDLSSGSFLFPFDIDLRSWSTALADAIGYPIEKLPRLVEATDTVGELSRIAAGELGLPSGIRLVAGGGDGQCAGAGSGTILPGRVMVNIGTGAGIQAFQSSPRRDPACTLNVAAHVIGGAWEMEGHTQASGAALRWFRDNLGKSELAIQKESSIEAYTLLIDEAMTAPPGAEGLLFLPTLNGSTAPVVDLDARGCLLGLSQAHTRGHVIRAWLEGISLELRWMLDAMVEAGTPIEEIRLVGGGARDRRWNQIHADILGRPVTTVRSPDAAMIGGAMCAAMGLGVFPEWSRAAEKFVHRHETIEPSLSTSAVYSDLYIKYKDIFQLLSQGKAFAKLSGG